MDVQDLRGLEDGRELETELCIVGSGPAGLALATELIPTGLRILIVESGGLQEDPESDALSRTESIGELRVAEPKLLRNRMFGGTSHSWTGRCAPFDEMDFEVRPWVPFSGWPLSRRELEPFLGRAGSHLGLGRNCYDERLWDLIGRSRPDREVDEKLIKHCFWQYSTDAANSLDFMRFGPAFLAKSAPNVRILLNATATDLQTDPTGAKLLGVVVSTLEGKHATIRPKATVLCAGGIENARIMLCSNTMVAAGIGNENDLVGRFLMDHPRCTLGEFEATTADEVRARYGLFQLKEHTTRFFAPGLSLSPALQERMQLLNCAAWLTEDRAPDDPWDALKRILSRGREHPVRDAWSVVTHPKLLLRGLNDRLLHGRGLPHKLRRLVLDCIVEQRPDPESRLSLGEERDRLGMPVARLDWRISKQEKATVATLGGLIRDEFTRLRIGAPVLVDWVRHKTWDQARFTDVAHPTGTTRMAEHSRSGVVDKNCKVHGVEGLYVAGSSVFPTAGHANPTLMIVALAIRLADHLQQAAFRGSHRDIEVGSAVSARMRFC